MILLAEILDRFEPGAIGWTIMGLVAALAIVVLVLTAANQARRLFGRRPTLNEILNKLVSVDDHDEYKEEMRLRCLGLEKQISDARHSFDERANSDLVEAGKQFETVFRLIGERDKMMSDQNHIMARLQERTETHVRKFDQLEGKLDTALQVLPQRGRREPRNSDE